MTRKLSAAWAVLASLGAWLIAPAVRAESTDGPAPSSPLFQEQHRDRFKLELQRATESGPYFDLLATFMWGQGLRFNNPYRLARQLGQTGESLSTTAPYLDVALFATSGNPNGFQRGLRIGVSAALEGVPQEVISPAFAVVRRLAPWWVFTGWAGLPIIAEPDFNVGAEIGLGATFLARAGLGIAVAAVGDGFYGAGTPETRAPFYPVISLQVGLLLGYEVLP